MIAYRLTALQYGRVILEPSHPTRRPGAVETSVNVYDPAFTSYTEGSALTQPLQHLKKHLTQETIIKLSSLISANIRVRLLMKAIQEAGGRPWTTLTRG